MASEITHGSVIGRFTLLELLGTGGMGVVWAAYDPKLDRKVALKFVRTAIASTETLNRLQREAQALARVNHPNVVAVHDVGSDDAQIYIAQEYVHGLDLAAWLAAAPRSVSEIVSVFVQAGRGLAAAHAAGIVHRDVKPNNVLVGDDGRVRVVDFGLARETPTGRQPVPDDASTGTTPRELVPVTGDGAVVGTPHYMSPEQHLGQPWDARSDQFSFCAALYQALYRQLPFDGDTYLDYSLAAVKGELRTPPRATVPRHVREVVLRGLAAERDQRFPSMSALIAALDKRAGSRGIIVVGLAATTLLSLGLAAHFAAGEPPCSGEPGAIAEEWNEPSRVAMRAAFSSTGLPFASFAVRQGIAELDRYANDWLKVRTEVCRATRVRGDQSEFALDVRMSCLEQRRQALRATAELFARADRATVERSSRIVASLPSITDCATLDTSTSHLPTRIGEMVLVNLVRAQLASADVLFTADKYTKAIAVVDSALVAARAADDDPDIAAALGLLGRLRSVTREDAKARKALEESYLDATRIRHDDLSLRAAASLVKLSDTLARWDEGTWWSRVAHAVPRPDGEHEVDAIAAMMIGELLFHQGKPTEALVEFHRALSIRSRMGGNQSPLVADTRSAIGAVLDEQGKFDDALVEYKSAIAILETAVGPDHPEVAKVRHNVGTALAAQGHHAEALVEFRRARGPLEKAFGPKHPTVATVRLGIGQELHAIGDDKDAIPELEASLAIYEMADGLDHPNVAAALDELGVVLGDTGRLAEGEASLRRALAMSIRTLGPDHQKTAATRVRLGILLCQRNKFDEAISEQRAGLATLQQRLGVDHSDVGRGIAEIAGCLADMGKNREAVAEFQRSIPILEKSADYPMVGLILGHVGHLYLDLGDAPHAEQTLRRAVSILERISGRSDELSSVRFDLARALWSRDRATATALAEQALHDQETLPDGKEGAATMRRWLAAHSR